MNLLSLIVVAALSSAPAPSKLMVIDLGANGASPELAAALTGVTATELQRLQVFEVSTAQTVRDLLSLERQRQLLGCSEASCGLELSALLGAGYLVSGKVSRLADAKGVTFALELTLTDAKAGKGLGADVQKAGSERELVGLVARAVAKIAAPVLAAQSGALVITSAEHGATVKVDDVVKGTTPLAGRLTLPGGPHFVSVEKDGFTSFQKQLWIAPQRVAEEQVSLVPSPDYIKAYEANANRMRLGAWISTGVAAAGVATAIGFQLHASALFGSSTQPGTFEYERALLARGIEQDSAGDHRALAEALQASIGTSQALSIAGIGAAFAGAGAAAFFFISGEDPTRYSRYRELSLQFSPAPGGGYALLSGEY